MADKKDPKQDEAEVEERKRRVARRKPKAAAPAAEPAGEPAAGAEPAAKAAAKKAPAAKASAKKVDEPAAAKPKPRRTLRGKAAPSKPAPAARKKRPAHDYGDNPPMVRAHAKYVRTSARKARLVCDHIRGKSVEEARAILAHASRDVARDWSKLLESAVANAEHNHELIGDELRIAAVKADEGPTLKRFRPRAMGRATKIRKRTSHLSITLTPMDRER
jgi:ribosomal protein L22